MAADPNEPGHTQPPDKADGPTIWPESAGMAAQQSAANEMFKRNSERLQQAHENQSQTVTQEQPEPGKQGLSVADDHGDGNYNDLKLEHAEATGRESGGDVAQDNSIGEHDLVFVKDAGRGNYSSLKQEQAADTPEQESGEHELTFVKDAGRQNYAALTQEHAAAEGSEREQPAEKSEETDSPDKQLTFVKDQNHDLSRGP